MTRHVCFLALLACASTAVAIPALARKYGIPCVTCHVHGAKLNDMGLAFAAKGPSALGLMEEEKGVPITLYLSWLARQRQDSDDFDMAFSRLEVVALDRTSAFSWFLEWRLLSRDHTSTGFVDRSGRFEDLYALFDVAKNLGLQVGQFRALAQYDVSQRLSFSEPGALSRGMAGEASSDPRLSNLRSFSPAGRAPGVRVLYRPGEVNGWHAAATVPFPGEFSIPLSNEATDRASPELELRPKGALGEAWWQDGQNTTGVFVFSGAAGRSSFGVVANRNHDPLHLTASVARLRERSGTTDVASIDALHVRQWPLALGARLDFEARQTPALFPYASFHVPGPGNVFRFVLESRLQPGRRPLFTLELNFLH